MTEGGKRKREGEREIEIKRRIRRRFESTDWAERGMDNELPRNFFHAILIINNTQSSRILTKASMFGRVFGSCCSQSESDDGLR